MIKQLVMVKDIYDNWTYIFDVSKTEGKNIKNIEEAKIIINDDLGNFVKDILVTKDEMYIFSDVEIPCRNCN